MKIKLRKKENQYAQVHVNMLRDRSLSLKAKGLGAVLESYSNDFEVSLKSIEHNVVDGIKSIRTAIKELEAGYYLFRFQTRDEAGLFVTYWVFDSQKLEIDYLKSIIQELENVDLITNNDLLNGVSVLATPSGYPFSASRSTASRQSTTYNNNINQNIDYQNNPKGQGSDLQKSKVKLNLSQEAAEFRQKLLNSKYVGHLVPVMVEGEREDVYINEQGLLYTKSRTSKQILSSTLNEIWEQLHEINEARKKASSNPLQNLQIKKFGA
ncbi:MAG: hypothetical protein RBS91_03025 [Sulfurimonadaceae bacterium]|jgi:hypothetical protein|nr:hypothetical protein [Sulfurimonadaceae bacterium]